MTLVFPQDDEIKKYSSAHIYLKNHSLNKVSIGGGIVSAYADTYSVNIKSNRSYATYNADDVTAVVFE